MADTTHSMTPALKLAFERKIISQSQLDQCRELLRKSLRIGLNATLEEIALKQGMLSEESLRELQDLCELGEGGTQFGPYRLVRCIGEGGMGKVHEAVHEFMRRQVAIKVMNPGLMRDENNAERFFQEIRALAKLNHPNIVTIFDAGKVNRKYFYAMEFLEGESLQAHVEKNGPMAEMSALALARAVACALSHAHERSVVHRDVKPSNIIIGPHGTVKLTDFGLVMHYDEDHLALTQSGMMVGSPVYASPEQMDGGRDIDARSDIYSLGATIYFALTATTMFTGRTPQEVMKNTVTGAWVSPRRRRKGIRLRTVRLLRKMTARKRERRYRSMKEVIRTIERNEAWSMRRMLVAGSWIAVVFIAGALFQFVFDWVGALLSVFAGQ
jgi:serine/threonine protein kinase